MKGSTNLYEEYVFICVCNDDTSTLKNYPYSANKWASIKTVGEGIL